MCALYDFLIEIDISNFRPQRDVPLIDTNKLKKIDNMNNAFLFMKNNFVLKKVSKKMKTTELLEMYKIETGKYAMKRSNFYDRIKELNIRKYTSHGCDYFEINHELLTEEFNKRQLLSQSEDVIPSEFSFDGLDSNDNDNNMHKRIVDKDNEINMLKLQMEKLQRENDEYKKLLNIRANKLTL